jgi:hypothetical protein
MIKERCFGHPLPHPLWGRYIGITDTKGTIACDHKRISECEQSTPHG